MRVAVFTDSYLPAVDGVVNAIRHTRRCLEDRGHEVLIVAPRGENGHEPQDGVLYCRAKEFKRYPGYFMAFLPTRTELSGLTTFRPDLVHSHGLAFMGLKGMWAARELSLPLILTFHTMILDAVPYYLSLRRLQLVRWLLARYLRGLLHHSDTVVAPTHAVLQELLTIAPRMRRTAVVPNGVDLERFRPADGTEVRDRYGLSDAPLLLHVGRVAPEKDLRFLLEAFPRVRERVPGCRFLVVGTGPDLLRCRQWVADHGLADTVVFTGFVPDADLPTYYAAADALTVASRFETQGLVALEAMACGTPPVAVRHRAFPEYIADGVNGFLFPPGDVDGYLVAVERALACGIHVRRNARRTAEAFSWDRCTDRLLETYRGMLAGSTSG